MRSVRENITMELTYQFTNKEVTPWGGMAFLKQFLGKMSFSEQIAACEFLPQPGSNRGYSPSVLLEAFVCSIWCGATKFIHTELTRSDKALGKIFGWEQIPAQDAYKRFFNKFTQTDNLRTADYFFRWIIENYAIRQFYG